MGGNHGNEDGTQGWPTSDKFIGQNIRSNLGHMTNIWLTCMTYMWPRFYQGVGQKPAKKYAVIC